ncbi:hypothetical protein OROMI_003968 [Orobanche minor]
MTRSIFSSPQIDRRGEDEENPADAAPHDSIMELIFLKLPIKSLVRFKSVCKHWLSLISHSPFVQSYLKHLLSIEKIITFIPSSSEFYVLNLDKGNNNITIVQHHKYSLPLSVEAPDLVRLMGSCNGLICLGIYPIFTGSQPIVPFSPILWNPLLNDYKKVPFLIPIYIHWFGFGYDSHTQDYKFVRIDITEAVTQIYGLKSNSMRVFPFEYELFGIGPGCGGLYNPMGVYMNGSLYWLHSTSSLEFGFIVFNLRYEKCRFLKFPNHINIPFRNAGFSTIVRDSQLDVFFYKPQDRFFTLVTMIGNKVNGTISWSSINIQNPNLGILEYLPECVMMNGDIVMDIKYDDFPSRNSYHRIIYNPKRSTFECISTIHEGAEDLEAEYTTYIETLISPSNLINCSAP